MQTYFLPKKLKSELRKIWGIPIFGSKEEIVKKFEKISQEKKFQKIITVGDYCSLSLPSDVKIFDGKIKRKKVKKVLPYFLTCQNPAGTIQKEVWPIIKKAIKERKNIFVDGEEDLLVIPAVLLSEKKTAVVYGFPKKGVCLIEVNSKIKKILKQLLKKISLN
jgi:hypothetical protein